MKICIQEQDIIITKKNDTNLTHLLEILAEFEFEYNVQ